MEIRAEQPEDFAAIRDVVSAAFEHEAEANLVEAIRASPNYIPELSLVAIEDGQVVGHVMINLGLLRSSGTDIPVPMLSPLAVAPAYQRRGVGAALVRAVCALADTRGHPFVLLEGDPSYYGRFGFEPSFNYGIEMPLPDWAPPQAGQILMLAQHNPELVGSVIYPPYFEEATREREG